MAHINTNRMVGEFEKVLGLRCYACDRRLTASKYLVTCSDEQTAFVGSECFKHIRRAPDGWQPAKGGPRLFLIREG